MCFPQRCYKGQVELESIFVFPKKEVAINIVDLGNIIHPFSITAHPALGCEGAGVYPSYPWDKGTRAHTESMHTPHRKT